MDRAEIKRIHIISIGRVQGVSYRAYIQKNALELGLKGYVRNLSDGSVEIVGEGSDAQNELLIETAKNGSPFSRVDDLKISYEPSTGEFVTFSVKY